MPLATVPAQAGTVAAYNARMTATSPAAADAATDAPWRICVAPMMDWTDKSILCCKNMNLGIIGLDG
jgi:hypothetical protein